MHSDSRQELLFRNLMLLDAAAIAASTLEGEGIPSLVYKGCALFDYVLPLDGRTASDVDLFVPPGTFRQARDALAAHGFRAAALETNARAAHPAGAVIAPNGCAVDVHEELAQAGRFSPTPDVFRRGTRVRQGRLTFVRMHVEDLCLASAANLVKDEFTAPRNRLEEFSLILDVAMEESTTSPSLFAERMWKRARAWRLERGLWATLRWASCHQVPTNGGLLCLSRGSTVSNVWRSVLETTFDFSKASPLHRWGSRRKRQAIALPLLTDQPRRLWRPIGRFATARFLDRIGIRPRDSK